MPSGLLPGQSAPIGVITSTDRSAVVLIATGIALVVGFVSLAIRIYVRFTHSISWDDYTIYAATAFSVFQAATVFVEGKNGLGKVLRQLDTSELMHLQKAAYASNILFITTLWLTKCSTACLYLRLSPNHYHGLASKAALVGMTIVSLIISIFMIALSCDLAHPWLFIRPQCTNLYTRWLVFAIFDIVTEVVLFALSFYIIHGLQMPWTRKGSVLVTFGLRLLVIIPIAFRLHQLKVELNSDDPTYDGLFASIWTQIEMTSGLVAATIPCSRSWISATSTQLPIEPKNRKNTKYGSGRSKQSITLDSLSRWKKADRSAPTSSNNIHAYPEVQHTTSVNAPGDEHSVASNESSQGIIRKNVEWSVNYEELRGTPVQR
ncbi:hypothetical protein H2200_002833 [Cladophialophora chaetospira]|uniref:Rhodopsin domain-containing protein n=1 Tax=Cladophialophora chaetospira TaxID=386627 RepID=A0AA39CLR0_9EURO|nr:hypothetical protein H2200_002833 [Cladophialophora chaetospira]